jgi:hypothetical protein
MVKMVRWVLKTVVEFFLPNIKNKIMCLELKNLEKAFKNNYTPNGPLTDSKINNDTYTLVAAAIKDLTSANTPPQFKMALTKALTSRIRECVIDDTGYEPTKLDTFKKIVTDVYYEVKNNQGKSKSQGKQGNTKGVGHEFFGIKMPF